MTQQLRPSLLVLLAVSVFAQAPSKDDHAAELAAIKDYALNYSERLPNFAAVQVVRRQVKPLQSGRFSTGARAQTDTAEEQIGYVDHQELHKTLTVNGQKVKDGNTDQTGMFSRGEFGALLDTLFRRETRTEFQWDRMASIGGRKMIVFSFKVPQLPNGYAIMEGNRTLIVPYKGSLFADAETKAVMRIQITCTDIPSISAYRGVDLTVDYKKMQVAGQEFLLPSHFTMNLRRLDAEVTMDSTYRDYKRFAADATIIFEEEPQ